MAGYAGREVAVGERHRLFSIDCNMDAMIAAAHFTACHEFRRFGRHAHARRGHDSRQACLRSRGSRSAGVKAQLCSFVAQPPTGGGDMAQHSRGRLCHMSLLDIHYASTAAVLSRPSVPTLWRPTLAPTPAAVAAWLRCPPRPRGSPPLGRFARDSRFLGDDHADHLLPRGNLAKTECRETTLVPFFTFVLGHSNASASSSSSSKAGSAGPASSAAAFTGLCGSPSVSRSLRLRWGRRCFERRSLLSPCSSVGSARSADFLHPRSPPKSQPVPVLRLPPGPQLRRPRMPMMDAILAIRNLGCVGVGVVAAVAGSPRLSLPLLPVRPAQPARLALARPRPVPERRTAR